MVNNTEKLFTYYILLKSNGKFNLNEHQIIAKYGIDVNVHNLLYSEVYITDDEETANELQSLHKTSSPCKVMTPIIKKDSEKMRTYLVNKYKKVYPRAKIQSKWTKPLTA